MLCCLKTGYCRCVALFAAGEVNTSIREMRAVLRKYPDFPDTWAALTAALWSIGKEGEAESNWCESVRVWHQP
jgi:predicted Zn-dependent protease